MEKLKVEVCPKTGKEVVMQYAPGSIGVIPDWLCLHGDSDEEDAENVKKFRQNKKMRTIQQIQEDVHSTVKSKGFWDQEQLIDKASIENAQEIRDLIIAQKLALIHSEVSEALEACRAGKRADVESYNAVITIDETEDVSKVELQSRAYKDYMKDSLEGELAGTVIRVMDLCGWLGIDLGWFIEQELEYNKSRATKHGKKY